MNTSTENGSLADRGPAGEAKPVKEEKSTLSTDKNRITPFRPKPVLLLDVLAEGGWQTESLKPAEKTAGKVPAGQAGDSPQGMLETLLRNTETCALRTQKSKLRWQLAALLMGTLLVACGLLIGLMTYEMTIGVTQKGRLAMENQTLKSQVNSAGVQIDGLKKEIENLMNRKSEVTGGSHGAATALAGAVSTKEEKRQVNNIRQQAAAVEQVIDTSRIEAIKKGNYPLGASKTELMTAMGQPDRVYAARNYEQLVYFGRKPGRFWFIGEYLVEASE